MAIIGVIVIGLPLLLYLAQDSLIFHPRPMAEAQRTALAKRMSVESVFIEAADGTRLHAWHVKGDPLVIYFGGNAEEVSWMLEHVARRAPGGLAACRLSRLRLKRRFAFGEGAHPGRVALVRPLRCEAHVRLWPQPRQRRRGAARCRAAVRRRDPGRAVRQPGGGRQAALSLPAGRLDAQAPFRLGLAPRPRSRRRFCASSPRTTRSSRPSTPSASTMRGAARSTGSDSKARATTAPTTHGELLDKHQRVPAKNEQPP